MFFFAIYEVYKMALIFNSQALIQAPAEAARPQKWPGQCITSLNSSFNRYQIVLLGDGQRVRGTCLSILDRGVLVWSKTCTNENRPFHYASMPPLTGIFTQLQ